MIPKKTPADETLRARGLRLTAPRRVILDTVRATDAHPSALAVYRTVRRQLPRVSLATVYRNLRQLAAEGLLRERAGIDGLRFDGNVERHDHFTCLTCRRVFDVPPAQATGTRKRIAARTGFEVLEHRVEFFGRCAACRRRRAGRGAKRAG
jgi:Fur family transcriptional regulator, peroxide stress response regulator